MAAREDGIRIISVTTAYMYSDEDMTAIDPGVFKAYTPNMTNCFPSDML